METDKQNMITKLLCTLEHEERAEIDFLRAEGVDVEEEDKNSAGSMSKSCDPKKVDRSELINQMLTSLSENTGNIEPLEEHKNLSDEYSSDDEEINEPDENVETHPIDKVESMVMIVDRKNIETVNVMSTAASTMSPSNVITTKTSPMLTTGMSLDVQGTNNDSVYVQQSDNFLFNPTTSVNNQMVNGVNVIKANDNNINDNNITNNTMSLVGGITKDLLLSPSNIDAVQYPSLMTEDDLLYPNIVASELDYTIPYGKFIFL